MWTDHFNSLDRGTDIYFVWISPRNKESLLADLSTLLDNAGCVHRDTISSWMHDVLGNFSCQFDQSGTTGATSICLSFDCDLLPELNDPGFERPQSPPIAIYGLAKLIFATLDADEGFAATQTDGVGYFNFDDPLISRIFKLSKSGPQKLVRPYEDGRPVSFSDLARDPITTEPNWVLHMDGRMQ